MVSNPSRPVPSYEYKQKTNVTNMLNKKTELSQEISLLFFFFYNNFENNLGSIATYINFVFLFKTLGTYMPPAINTMNRMSTNDFIKSREISRDH